MHYGIPKLLPCSVCGAVSFRHDGWFLAMENRWLDHLKILTWHSSLARKREVRSACCRDHLQALVAYWLEEASLHLASPRFPPIVPLAGHLAQGDFDLDPLCMGQLVGELSVCREPLSRGWQGSSTTLASIMEALAPEPAAHQPSSRELRFCDGRPGYVAGLTLHQGRVKLPQHRA
jgi:hypothetical protein